MPSHDFEEALLQISLALGTDTHTKFQHTKYDLLCCKIECLNRLGRFQDSISVAADAIEFANSCLSDIAGVIMPHALNAYGEALLGDGQRIEAEKAFSVAATSIGMEGRKARYLLSRLN
jgi:hypothetical protein